MKNCVLIVLVVILLSISSLGISSQSSTAQYSVFMVKDINPDQNEIGGIGGLTALNGKVYFGDLLRLWKSDGTYAGTNQIDGSSGSMINPGVLTPMGQNLYFSAIDKISSPGCHGLELWTTDGTNAGTYEVKDIRPGEDGSIPMDLTNVNGQLFFTAYGGEDIGLELFVSDGTAAGTRMVKDINPGFVGSSPRELRNLNGKLMFVADSGPVTELDAELWTSDGTAAGTKLVKNIKPGTGADSSSWPQNLVVVGGLLFFVADDGAHGYEVWKSDGTTAGTVMVKDLDVSVGVGSNPINLTNVNGTLYFSAPDWNGSVGHGYELWKSDGTAAGTVRITDLNNWGFYDGGAYHMTYFKGLVYFTISHEGEGFEVWRTNGTEAGTVQFTDINPFVHEDYWQNGCDPTDFRAVNDRYLFFVANDGVHGRELWMTDGTTQGTQMVEDIFPGSNIFDDPAPTDLVAVGSDLYFTASDGVYGRELWMVKVSLNPPGKATLISPSGSISVNQPTYRWNAVADATHYLLWVNDGSGASGKINTWYTAADAGCAAGTGTCSVTQSTALAAGAGTWWIQTWNTAGYGPWSDGMNFTVSTGGLPGKAVLISPAGSTSVATPTYVWNAVPNATYYYLWVNDSSGASGKIKTWYTAADAGCAAGTGTCSVTPATALASGAAAWWIQTWNSAGYGPWSDGMNFVVSAVLPGKATLVSPGGSATVANPSYVWNAVPNATYYYLWVNDSSGASGKIKTWYTAADAGCAAGTGLCSVTPATALASGGATWWIQTWNPTGYGPWSDGLNFSVR